jgi:RHS repeat-associated protein
MWRDADGTYFVRARVYDAVTGRFLSRDPFVGLSDRPETYIPYGFAGQNPRIGRDPTGVGDHRELKVSDRRTGLVPVVGQAGASRSSRDAPAT